MKRAVLVDRRIARQEQTDSLAVEKDWQHVYRHRWSGVSGIVASTIEANAQRASTELGWAGLDWAGLDLTERHGQRRGGPVEEEIASRSRGEAEGRSREG